jgi:hypothetical protein
MDKSTLSDPSAQAIPPRPQALPVIPEQIPEPLKALKQFVVWRYFWMADKHIWDKPPLNGRTGNAASSTNPATWATFEQAMGTYATGKLDGVGFVLCKKNQRVGCDLDHCRDPATGEIDAWAWDIIQALNTYTEISPSGTGFHLLAEGALPGKGRKKGAIEFYDTARYLTLTGQHLDGTPTTIEPRQEAINSLLIRVFGTPQVEAEPQNPQPNGNPSSIEDDEILVKACAARNSGKFTRLWNGDTTDYTRNGNPGQSEADLGLCALIAFWTRLPEQIDRLFRRSGLMRPKWDETRGETTYGAETIRKALVFQHETWHGRESEVDEIDDTSTSNDTEQEKTDNTGGETPPQQLGGVKAKADGYYRARMIKEAWVETRISSFIVKPTLRIWIDGSEAVRANIRAGKNTVAEVTIERHCWHSRGAFLKVLPSLDQWCVATDNEIQAIQALVASQKVPSKRGTRTLGLIEGVWVSDEGIFDASGWMQDPSIVYLPPGGESPLAGRLRYRAQHPSERLSVAQSVYSQVWKLNELTVIGGLIGWFFSTPFKPQIHVRLNHFPILNVWGTMGAGKTSLLRLFWKLFGVDSELLACTDTEFSLLSLLSATSSIPLVFDEFKPYDMKPDQVRRFERILRRVYDGDTEHRGRPDLRLITYRLMAPVAVAGEVSVARQPAMRERIIPVSPSKTWLPEHEEARKAYAELVKLPLYAFASLFIEWSMRQDFTSSWAVAEKTLAEHLDRDIPERIRDGLHVISFGLRQFEQFGLAYGFAVPDQLDLSSIFRGIVDQLVSADGRARVGLDILLEHLASMAEMGRIEDGKHYHLDMAQDRLALRLDSCLAEYRRYARDTASDDEVLSKESYMRQLRENHASHGYVLALSERVYYTPAAADRLRSVIISISKAEASDIDLGGFTRSHE